MNEEIKNIDFSDNYNQFNITLDEYEGPIDLLLDLAKKQKVDLSKISILKLAEQYLSYINEFKEIHLEIAADYLVMAAWLSYLKSRLLLPKDKKENEPSAIELEEALKFQLQRLQLMKKASKDLDNLPLIGRDIFYRGYNNDIKIVYEIDYYAKLFDLLKIYSSLLLSKEKNLLHIQTSELMTVDDAIKRFRNIFGEISQWTNFINVLPKMGENKIINKSKISSNFVASLELTKNGDMEIKQNEMFGDIYLRSKQ